MTNKLLKSLIVLSAPLFLVGCTTQPFFTDVVEVSDATRQLEMYEQVINSDFAPASDGNYSFAIQGVAKLGMFSTNVNGTLNYNYQASDQVVTIDFNFSGMGISANGALNETQELTINVFLFGIRVFNTVESLGGAEGLALGDLPDLIELGLSQTREVFGSEREECLTNYRSAKRVSEGTAFDLNLFEVNTTKPGLICSTPDHFRTNPSVGFMLSGDELKGAYFEAQLRLEQFEFDLELFVTRLNS